MSHPFGACRSDREPDLCDDCERLENRDRKLRSTAEIRELFERAVEQVEKRNPLPQQFALGVQQALGWALCEYEDPPEFWE